MNPDYSLTDLARLADVTPRTVRYYVAQGLLPSPDAAGPATRYSEGHLARLRLIRRLQRDHLPLAEIRERLEQMTDAEVAAALAATLTSQASLLRTAAPEPADTVDYIRSLMEQASIEPNIHPAAMPPASAPVPPEPSTRSRLALNLRRVESSAPSPSMPAPPQHPAETLARDAWQAPASAPVPSQAADERSPGRTTRSTWERVVISPDIEIHVRRPLKPLDNKRADTLERYARELFQDEP